MTTQLIQEGEILVFELRAVDPEIPTWARRAGYGKSDRQIYLPVELFTEQAIAELAFEQHAEKGEGLSWIDGSDGPEERRTLLASCSFLRRCFREHAEDIGFFEHAARTVVERLLADGS